MRALTNILAVVALFGVMPSALAEFENDNVVILLDASGSMAEDMRGVKRMAAAKRAIAEVLKQTPESTQVGLLVFSGSDKKYDWVFPLGPRDDAKLQQLLSKIRPSGGTPLGRYMRKASNALLEESKDQMGYGTYRLLVVTDGVAGDSDLVRKYAPMIQARGIVLDVIGVAMKQSHTLASTANSYRRADDAASLTRAISEVMGEVGGDAGGVADQEAFEILNGFPDEVVYEMVQALTTSNHEPLPLLKSDRNSKKKSTPRPASQSKQRKKSVRVDQDSGVSPVLVVAVIVIANIVLKALKS